MEYEIDDDPQGQPDRPDGDRKGGLREDWIFFRKATPRRHTRQLDEIHDEDSPVEQFREAA